MTATKAMMAVLALGVALGGCATRESVENAQASANAADRRAMNAQGRADDAYGVGHDAKSTALIAEQKADQANAEISAVKQRITAMEWQGKPQKKARKARSVQTRTNS